MQSLKLCGRDSWVGTATRYGLDGPGIESQWGRDFQHTSRPALGPTQPPVQWVPGLSQPGCGADHPPQSKCRGHERVGLYLYSPSGPSSPVIGKTFTFFTFKYLSQFLYCVSLQATYYTAISNYVNSFARFKNLLAVIFVYSESEICTVYCFL